MSDQKTELNELVEVVKELSNQVCSLKEEVKNLTSQLADMKHEMPERKPPFPERPRPRGLFHKKETNYEEVSKQMYSKVEEWVITQDIVSISMLQRHFGIGFPMAAKLIDMLTENGIILEPDENNCRKVIVTRVK